MGVFIRRHAMTDATQPAAPTPMSSADALLPLTLDDFRAAGVYELLAAHPDADIHELHNLIAAALRASSGTATKALMLLGGVTSMMLVPEEPSVIYRPRTTWGDRTGSMGPDHLTASVIDVLVMFVDSIERPQALRARLADLVFFRESKRGPRFARMAIAAYRAQGAITFEAWHHGEGAGWHRALQLAKLIRDGNEVQQIEQTLLTAFFADLDAEGVDPEAYLRPLYAEKGGRTRAGDIASALETLARRHLASDHAFPAQSYFEGAARWYKVARKPDEQADMVALAAEAIALQATQGNSAILEHTFLVKAIEAYRQVSGPARERLDIANKIEALRRRHQAAGHAVLGEMRVVRGPSIDVSDEAQAAIQHVTGRNPLMALMAFCGLDSPPDAAQLLADAAKSLQEHPISALSGSATMADDGRLVESTGPQKKWAEQVAAKARDTFRWNAAYKVHSAIGPALNQLRSEHNYRIDDFIAIAERSPVVPVGRVRSVAKALHAGFYGDMVQAIHILMPQFEHMVRQVLQGAGAFTAEHSLEGLDSEIGLSSLVKRPQMAEEFGEGLTLAINALMCDRAGPNLRNDVAHGLADEALCESVLALYAWWLVLQLVVETFASTLDGLPAAEAQ